MTQLNLTFPPPPRPKFEHRLVFRPAYDKTVEGYGVHGMELYFACLGPEGAISLALMTDWHLRSTHERWALRGQQPPIDWLRPRGRDLSYHARRPQHPDHESTRCDILPQGHCYCESSSLYADEWIEGFLAGGLPWLQPKLEDEYMHRVHDGPAPDLSP